VLAPALAAAAFVAGLTGTWSPCGFSMIETIGRPRRRVATSCATLALGACAGGVVTFGTLAWLGAFVPGEWATVVAVLIAAVVIVADASGTPIAPQIRRQVPEWWRHVMPLPVAAGLYGVLLGLGFTTYVLTFAVWGVAVLSFAVGEPIVGVAAGLAFGIGRALPIVVTAPIVHRPAGAAVLRAMAERPAVLRGTRLADAAAVALAATALFAAEARGANNIGPGTDPSASGELFAWTTPAGGMFRRAPGEPATPLPGRPAVGGSLVAWRTASGVQVASATDLAPVLDLPLPSVDALAVNDAWLVTRERRTDGGDSIVARPLPGAGEARVVATVAPPAQLGRPSLDGNIVVFHLATRRRSQIVAADLAAGTSSIVRTSRRAQLTNPSVHADQLLFVRQTNTAQRLELGRLKAGATNRVIYRLRAPASRDPGHEPGHSRVTRTPRVPRAAGTLWTTALSAEHAFVTFVPRRGGVARASIVSISR
jgi:hypothetical protein